MRSIRFSGLTGHGRLELAGMSDGEHPWTGLVTGVSNV